MRFFFFSEKKARIMAMFPYGDVSSPLHVLGSFGTVLLEPRFAGLGFSLVGVFAF